MKKLTQYILEQIKQYRVYDLTVIYNVNPKELVLQAPEKYSESDIQIYMDDKWLKGLPSDPSNAVKVFGNNHSQITDSYFEYDSFEHISVTPSKYIEWDSNYDKNATDDLGFFVINNLRYIIKFDHFDLVDLKDESEIKDQLTNIFTSAESNNANKWPIEIKLNQDTGLDYRT